MVEGLGSADILAYSFARMHGTDTEHGTRLPQPATKNKLDAHAVVD
jgi:hypothetical protein